MSGRLTPTQYRVLATLAQTGDTHKEVAHRLGISPQTVKNHLTQAYERLGVQCQREAFIVLGWLRAPGVSA